MGLLDGILGSPRERFARRVLTAMRDAGVAQARYLPEQFAIEVRRDSKASSPSIAYLGNLYRECERSGRGERRERIAAFLAAVVFNPGAPQTWEEVAPLLRPLLRTVTFGLGVPGSAPRPLRRPALPYVAEFVVVDQPTSIMYVTPKQVQDWGVTENGVFDRARRNMAELARRTEDAVDGSGPRTLVRMVESGDAYWASHLFVEGWLARQRARLGGRPVLFVPDATGVLLVGEEDSRDDGLAKLFELVEQEYREAARPISPMAYTVDDDGAVVPYSVPADHPMHRAAHRAEVLLASAEYAAQAEHLEQPEQPEQSAGPFVASCSAVQRPDGAVFSVATWAEGVDTLLPRADYVAFPPALPRNGESFMVAWDDVAREVDLEPVADLEPVRFRLRQWPHPGVVERLRKVAVSP
jgi:hypothetical protein